MATHKVNFNPHISDMLYKHFTGLPVFMRPSIESHRAFVKRVFPEVSKWAHEHEFDQYSFDTREIDSFMERLIEKVEGLRQQFIRETMESGAREGINPSPMGTCE